MSLSDEQDNQPPAWEKRDSFIRNLVCGLLFFHIVAATVLLPTMGKNEIFPIFDWQLYSSPDPRRTIYELQTVPPISDLPNDPSIFSSTHFYLIQDAGKSLVQEEPRSPALLKQIDAALKSRFGQSILSYSIWEMTADINEFHISPKTVPRRLVYESEQRP